MGAFTAGYDLHHPHRIVGWHSYDRATRVAHWTDHTGLQQRRSDTVAALRAAFSAPLAPSRTFGRRTVADYEAYIATPLIEPVG
jgi:hypothetical protein